MVGSADDERPILQSCGNAKPITRGTIHGDDSLLLNELTIHSREHVPCSVFIIAPNLGESSARHQRVPLQRDCVRQVISWLTIHCGQFLHLHEIAAAVVTLEDIQGTLIGTLPDVGADGTHDRGISGKTQAENPKVVVCPEVRRRKLLRLGECTIGAFENVDGSSVVPCRIVIFGGADERRITLDGKLNAESILRSPVASEEFLRFRPTIHLPLA